MTRNDRGFHATVARNIRAQSQGKYRLSTCVRAHRKESATFDGGINSRSLASLGSFLSILVGASTASLSRSRAQSYLPSTNRAAFAHLRSRMHTHERAAFLPCRWLNVSLLALLSWRNRARPRREIAWSGVLPACCETLGITNSSRWSRDDTRGFTLDCRVVTISESIACAFTSNERTCQLRSEFHLSKFQASPWRCWVNCVMLVEASNRRGRR